jgi:hypothetical protein
MGEINDPTTAELLYREWQYRHTTFWKTMHLWGALILATEIGPFLKSDLRDIGWAVLIFPAVGLYLSCLGAWHLAAESERMRVVATSFDKVRGFKPKWTLGDGPQTLYVRLVSLSAADMFARLFLFGLGSTAISSALVLATLQGVFAGCARAALLGLAALLPLVGAACAYRDVLRKPEPAAEGISVPGATIPN